MFFMFVIFFVFVIFFMFFSLMFTSWTHEAGFYSFNFIFTTVNNYFNFCFPLLYFRWINNDEELSFCDSLIVRLQVTIADYFYIPVQTFQFTIAAMSFLALAIRCIPKNHFVSGVFDLWKIVPAFAEVCARQAEHWKMRRALLKLWTVPPQSGHTNPSGHRIATRAAWHWSSVPYRFMKSAMLSPFWN